MKKTLTISQMRFIGNELFRSWDEYKKEIKLPAKSLHTLIALKKRIENELAISEEALTSIVLSHGGEVQQDGGLFIPEGEQREAANKALFELGTQEVEIDYEEITLNSESILPVGIYDAIFDFIKFEE